MRTHRYTAFVALGALAALALPGTAQQLDIQEWDVPYADSRPRDPYVGPSGDIWFVGQRSDYVAVLDPASGEFRRYALEDGAGPHNLIVAPDGAIWYAGNRAAHIGKLDPATGAITKYPMPDPAARDPHTLIFDGAGDIWFTVQGGGFIGKLDTGSGDVRLVKVPGQGTRPYGIVMDETDRPWVVEFGTNKVATVDPQSFELREFILPRPEIRPRRLARTSDGMIWYGDYAGGYLGRLDPATGEVKEWLLPGGAQSRPYAMALDDRDRIWVAESGLSPNRLVGFDPATEQFFGATEVPSGGGTVRHMVFDPATRAIWFGADTNTIGRLRVP